MEYLLSETMETAMDTELLHEGENIELGEGIRLERIGQVREFLGKAEDSELVIGDPERAMEHWHMQNSDVSCAICCQEFIAEELLGQEFSEEVFSRVAEEWGWFNPEVGTPQENVGLILEKLGLSVERGAGYRLSDLAQALSQGDKIICGVNNMILEDVGFADIPGITANHAVEVIGIDVTHPDHVQVILNDPGVPNGCGRRIALEVFEKAWASGDHFAVIAREGGDL